MIQEHYRRCHIEKHRAWTAWSATVPFMLGYVMVISMLFWDFINVEWGVPITILFAIVGMGLSHISGPKYAILPFIYCNEHRPGKTFTVVKYKTYWGTSRGKHYIWQEAIRILPGVYRLRGDTFEAENGEMFRCPDVFHSEDEYDQSENDDNV